MPVLSPVTGVLMHLAPLQCCLRSSSHFLSRVFNRRISLHYGFRCRGTLKRPGWVRTLPLFYSVRQFTIPCACSVARRIIQASALGTRHPQPTHHARLQRRPAASPYRQFHSFLTLSLSTRSGFAVVVVCPPTTIFISKVFDNISDYGLHFTHILYTRTPRTLFSV